MNMGFDGGVEYGGLRNGHEVSVLICYLLKNISVPLTKTELSDALLNEGLVNYFELTNSLSELVKLNQVHVTVDVDGTEEYTLTDIGTKNLGVIETELPASVREKAVNAVLRILAMKKRLQDNRAEIIAVKDGFKVNMQILDIGSDLLDLELFVPDAMVAKQIRNNFLNDPQLLYKGILALLMGDLKSVGELIPSEENNLFD